MIHKLRMMGVLPLLLFVPYALTLAILYLAISIRVICLRYKHRSLIGHAESKELEYGIRGHANFSEYVPFGLLMAGLCYAMQSPVWLMHFILASLTIGRLFHAYCFLARHNFIVRRVGMILTFISLITSTIYLCISLF